MRKHNIAGYMAFDDLVRFNCSLPKHLIQKIIEVQEAEIGDDDRPRYMSISHFLTIAAKEYLKDLDYDFNEYQIREKRRKKC